LEESCPPIIGKRKGEEGKRREEEGERKEAEGVPGNDI
jgi:hypothetical protein